MQGNDHSPRTPAQLAAASLGADDVKAILLGRAPRGHRKRSAAAWGSRRKPDFDRGNDWLRRIRRRLILEIQLKCLAQVGQCLVDGPALAGDLNAEAASHIPVAVWGDGGGQPDCPVQDLSLSRCGRPSRGRERGGDVPEVSPNRHQQPTIATTSNLRI